MIKLLIVEKKNHLLEGGIWKAIIDPNAISVVYVGSIDEAVELEHKEAINVIIVSGSLLIDSHLESRKTIDQNFPNAKFYITSMYEEESFKCFAADGFVSKKAANAIEFIKQLQGIVNLHVTREG
ncbi:MULTISPECIES: hypothetical protein [unclassified Paenibacillus]|uniref:hypothetical protein n=1 Tax=unclassified Paenibacillus TaxID=185978 RepID=UPI0027809D84|nr:MULTISPECIES: hypothetical protein [unclassified Paenibacillus]MDQ0896218.1 DNA-binding NarL/FixJ family response regulator [Paenibacillus sp. V4I7]MDQ0913966.1 DNA-binding NarL/FixJ family response regulator [Paenibacillus sp. V4I5]